MRRLYIAINAGCLLLALWLAVQVIREFSAGVRPLLVWLLAAGGGYFLSERIRERS